MKKFNLIKNKNKGKLIIFEGIDGSGKTTLIKLLMEQLKSKGQNVTYLKMPSERMKNLKVFNDYDNSLNNDVRNTINLTNLTIMVSGDRLISQDEVIIPSLKRGEIVICDRYCFTGYVRCSEDIIYEISKRFIEPNIVFLCDCSPKIAKNRIMQRDNEKNNYYNEQDVILQREKFLELAKLYNFCIIDTSKDIEYCLSQIIQQIEKL